MLNEIKKVLLKPYNEQLDEYRAYKSKFDELEAEIVSDSSEQEYASKKESLKQELKSTKDKQQYEKNLQTIMIEYKNALDAFNRKVEDYNTMKAKLSVWNVYEIKRKMENINKAEKLEQLNLTLEQAKELCNENGIEFRIDLEQV